MNVKPSSPEGSQPPESQGTRTVFYKSHTTWGAVTYNPRSESDPIYLTQNKTNLLGMRVITNFQFKQKKGGPHKVQHGDKVLTGKWERISSENKTTSLLARVISIIKRWVDSIIGKLVIEDIVLVKASDKTPKHLKNLGEQTLWQNLQKLERDLPGLDQSGQNRSPDRTVVRNILSLMEAGPDSSTMRIQQKGVFSLVEDSNEEKVLKKLDNSVLDVRKAWQELKELQVLDEQGAEDKYFKISLTDAQSQSFGQVPSSHDDKVRIIQDAVKGAMGKDSTKMKVFINFSLFLHLVSKRKGAPGIYTLAQQLLGPMLMPDKKSEENLSVNCYTEMARFLIANANTIFPEEYKNLTLESNKSGG